MMHNNQPKPRQDLTFGSREKAEDNLCRCYICKGQIKFQAPSELVDAFTDGRVALFVGAGVSTETPDAIETPTLYQQIAYILGKQDENLSFPDLMEELCKSPSGRVGLTQRIKTHFDYIYSHQAIYSKATRFHRQLATFFPIDTIITTNWDTYFEDECGAVPFVYDTDIPLWDVARRRVLKIHGTISNYGSIIATRADYTKRAKDLKSGVLGQFLTSLLATRTVVFVGYSLRDEDFLQIYEATRAKLSDFHKQAYFVSPTISGPERSRLESMGLRLIETDGEFFIKQLKEHARSVRCICPDEMYDKVIDLLVEVEDALDWLRATFSIKRKPQYLISAWYLDGMQHALERILRLKRTGIYSDLHRLQYTGHSYFRFAKSLLRDGKFDDAAYCEGYANAMLFAWLSPDGRNLRPPLFFYFGGFGTSSKSRFVRNVSKFPTYYKRANRFLERTRSKFKDENDEFVIIHFAKLNLTPYLNDGAILG
jgi:NAD-dependent SIR2 family protein deacetylase